MIFKTIVFLVFGFILTTVNAQTYRMPGEDLEHEGTWLQWPHNNLYGPYYQGDVEAGWVTMVQALEAEEKVHIIALDNTHKNHIIALLNTASIPQTNIDFYIHPTDDVWVRDNGPVFVYNQNNELTILDWGFNGWGGDTPFSNCDVIPASISSDLNIPRVDLSAMVLEGGAIEHDGQGTMIATRSCITHSSRNPGLTETQIEQYMTTYLGFTKFIWLDGIYGQDITDHHIDGFLKFANDSTIVTMDSLDLDYWLVTGNEINTIYTATNANNVPYNIVTVPLTQNNVQTTYGTNLGNKGSYCNYYIGNGVVLVPVYNDPNDAVALNIIQGLYPNRTVVGINVQNLYEYGGMTHCVTQQQPIDLTTNSINDTGLIKSLNFFPNPAKRRVNIELDINMQETIQIKAFDANGKLVESLESKELMSGENTISLDLEGWSPGIYFFTIEANGQTIGKSEKVVLLD